MKTIEQIAEALFVGAMMILTIYGPAIMFASMVE